VGGKRAPIALVLKQTQTDDLLEIAPLLCHSETLLDTHIEQVDESAPTADKRLDPHAEWRGARSQQTMELI
jgi:hypothetical protein